MENAPINKVLNDAFRETVENWKKEGMSDEDIIAKIEKIDFTDVMMSITDTASCDYTTFFRERMYEIELEERANAQEFSAHQEQLWGKCFAASQTMYTLTVEAAETISNFVNENASAEEKEARQFRFLALQHIHGRACQMFLEILTLLRNGFGDCAYARWRSLYELNCIAYFIKAQGEKIAKQYYEQSQSNEPVKDYAWTVGAINKKASLLRSERLQQLKRIAKWVRHGMSSINWPAWLPMEHQKGHFSECQYMKRKMIFQWGAPIMV